jgi:hypothetical protein
MIVGIFLIDSYLQKSIKSAHFKGFYICKNQAYASLGNIL